MSWRQWLLKFSNSVWLVAVFLLVTLAVYVALGRNLMPLVAAYKDNIEQYLEGTLGAPMSVGAIRGGWDGLNPVLFVKDVHLNPEDESSPAFSMRDFRLRLNVWQSLRRQKLIFQDIYVTGIGLQLEQSADGSWQLAGGLSRESGGADWAQIRQYLEQPNVDVAEVELSLTNHDGEVSVWRLPRVHMRDLGNAYEASGSVLQPGSHDQFLQFSLRGKGNPFGRDFSGLVYADWRSGPFLDPFLEAYSLGDVRLSHMDANGRSWLTFDRGRLQDIQGSIRLKALQWRTDSLAIAPVENLSLKFHLQLQKQDWQLSVDQLDFYWQGARWRPSSLVVSRHTGSPNEDSSHLSVRANRVPVGLMSALAQATQLLPVAGVEQLAGREPVGELRNLSIQIPLQENSRDLFEMRANLDNVSLSGFHSAPGVTGVNGYLALTDRHGLVEFQSRNIGLHFPDLFASSWKFAQGEGVVSWQRQDNATEVTGKGIRLHLPDARGSLSGGFYLLTGGDPEDDQLEDRFALSLGIRHFDASLAPEFMPCRIISDNICNWVAENVKSGQISEGSYLYNGSIEKGSDHQDVVSRLFLRMNQAMVSFHPDWPVAENLNATLLQEGSTLDVSIHKALLAGTDIRDARVWIPGAEGKESAVHVELESGLSGDQVKAWLAQPALSEHTGKAVQELEMSGQYQTRVRLEIPLEEAPVVARVTTSTHDGSLTIPSLGLSLEGVNGTLAFDSDQGFAAEGIEARALGQPLSLAVESPQWQPEQKAVRVQATGQIALDSLFSLWQTDPVPGLAGDAAFEAGVLLMSGGETPGITLDVQSDLEGVLIDWPEPMRKDAAEKVSVRYIHRFPDATPTSEARFAFGDSMNGRLVFQDGEYQRGVISFADQNLESDYPGTLIKGRLKRVAVEAWRSFLEDRINLSKEAVSDVPALKLDLSIDRLDALERQFQAVHLTLGREDSGWRVAISNPQQISGQVQIPDDESTPIVARFDYLRLDNVVEEEIGERLSPRKIPLLDLEVKDLALAGQDYGAWSFQTERREHGTIFRDVKGRVAGARIQGRLSWFEDPQTSQHTTIVTGTINGRKVERLVEHWGKTSSMTSDQMEFDLGLVWPAAPMDFSIAKASGSVALKMENGVFRDTNRSADAVRIFGVLNMDSITRRLRLDFSDLYKKGLSYDLMEGKAALSYGVMKFEKPLAIQAPSSAYKITGQADLNAETLNMEMVTILPVTQNLPLAALLVGAPQVGGALFLIDRLLGDPLSRLTSVTYSITGKFQEPKVELQGVFDTKTRDGKAVPVPRKTGSPQGAQP